MASVEGGGLTVHFIGAGPGAPDLLTLRGQRLVATSPVCLYAGALVGPEVLEHTPAGARLVDTQGLDLDAIVAELGAAHRRGEEVARLQSGDLSIWSAVAEQARRLDELEIPWDLTPGGAGVRGRRRLAAAGADAAGGGADGHPYPLLAPRNADATR